MLKDEQIKIGNKYRGLINNCLVEIVDIKTNFKNTTKYVYCKDLKTNKLFWLSYETFKHLLLEEVTK